MQNQEKKKVLIVTGTLSCGGITSFLIPLVNELSKRELCISLAYTKDEGGYLSRIDSAVRRIPYKRPTKKQAILACVKRLRLLDLLRIRFRNKKKTGAIAPIQRLAYASASMTHIEGEMAEPYDIAISSAEFGSNAIVAHKINAARKIGWVHPDMGALNIDVSAARKVLDRLDSVVAVSEAGYRSLCKKFPAYSQKFCCIENILDAEWVAQRSLDEVADIPVADGARTLVTVCRIDNSAKRVDRIIAVAKKMDEAGFAYRWYIIGEGPDKPMVEALIKDTGMEERVILLGKRENPYPYIRRADIFALTSQYEGRPVVIEEAKCLRIPIVCTCYGAAREQVTEQYGRVVSNTDGVLEEEMARCIMDGEWLGKTKASMPEYEEGAFDKVERLFSLF